MSSFQPAVSQSIADRSTVRGRTVRQTVSRQRPRFGSIRRAVALLCFVLAVPCAASDDAKPIEISNSELFNKSIYAAEQALAYYGVWDEPKELERIADIGYAIAQQAAFEDFPISFYLIDMPEPNAFALPGGQIFMSRGMIQLGLDDDMLAGLLGHEIGHVVLRHGIRMERRAKLLNLLSQSLLVGVIVAAENNREDRGPVSVYDPTRSSSGRGDMVQGAAAAGLVLSELLLRSYSREFEDEADAEGLRLAAAAGYAPDGTARLMAKMQAHLPESNDYGYWRTHPFFRDRVRAASARQEGIKPQTPSPSDRYRQDTQTVLLDYIDNARKLEEPAVPMLKRAGLTAWPRGDRADDLRRERLQTMREELFEKPELARDYSALIEEHSSEHDLVSSWTPESELLGELTKEIATLETAREEVYPRAIKVLEGGVYETDFLRFFLANHKESPKAAQVALALGDAEARLRRPSDAVGSYLQAKTADPDGEIGERAARGLRALAPVLEDLSALQKLALEGDDDLRALASERLAEEVHRYAELANGASYLRSHPEGEHVEAVTERLNSLAEELHGELLLYQQVGDQVKALARIQQILTDAPLSPAAERIREKAIFET